MTVRMQSYFKKECLSCWPESAIAAKENALTTPRTLSDALLFSAGDNRKLRNTIGQRNFNYYVGG